MVEMPWTMGMIDKIADKAIALSFAEREDVMFEFNGVKIWVNASSDSTAIATEAVACVTKGVSLLDARGKRMLPVQDASHPPPDTVQTIYGPVPRALLAAYPEVFERLFSEHPEVFAAVSGPA